MRLWKKSASLAAIAAITGGLMVGAAAPAKAMSLEEAAQLAVATNPQMMAAQENRRAQEYELKQGRGLYWPSLDLRAGWGWEWTDNTTINRRNLKRKEFQATLSQLLFDGFGREAKIEQRAARLDAAALRVQERADFLALDATEVYLDVLRNQDLVELATDNVAIHEQTLEQVQERVDAGQTGVGDAQQALSRLAAARDALIEAERDLNDAKARFIRVVGTEPEDLIAAPDLADQLPDSVGAAVSTAVKQSPTVAASAAELDEAIAVHREAASNYYPTFTLDAQTTRNHNIDGVHGKNHDMSVMLNMTWNVFRGFIDTNRRTELAHRIGEARAVTMDLERAAAEETRVSWNAFEMALRRVEALNEQVISNSQVVQTYRQEFDIGQRDLLDLLDGENELFLSRTNLISSEYVAQFAAFRVLATTGQLAEIMNVDVPAEGATGAREDAGITPNYQPGEALRVDANATDMN